MKVGLYDVDSKIPNLALMKLSAHHKAIGDDVEMYQPLALDSYDKIYASKIFATSDGHNLIPERMEIGGTGWDITRRLDPAVENETPDYSLYGYPHNIGFAMRGCRLKCKFCVVPQKEGRPASVKTIEEIWTQRDSHFLVLLDNDFFGNPEWWERISEILSLGLTVNFSQGINIRAITDEQAQALASVRFSNIHNTRKQVHFAWDHPREEKSVRRGYERCVAAGIKPWQMAFYVLIGFQSTPEEDLHRVETLRDWGCDPYVMPYDKRDPYQQRFTRWVNHKAIFNTCDWPEYKAGILKAPKMNPAQTELQLSDNSFR